VDREIDPGKCGHLLQCLKYLLGPPEARYQRDIQCRPGLAPALHPGHGLPRDERVDVAGDGGARVGAA
jgi:hypothetical protein